MRGFPECRGLSGARRKWCECENGDYRRCDKWRIGAGLDPAFGTITVVPENLRYGGERMKRHVSTAVAVVQDGKIVWERMDGLGDLVASILRRTRLDSFAKNLIRRIYGKTCVCAARQEWLNWLVPFRWNVWRNRFSLLFTRGKSVG